jgi:hypothetical protein
MIGSKNFADNNYVDARFLGFYPNWGTTLMERGFYNGKYGHSQITLNGFNLGLSCAGSDGIHSGYIGVDSSRIAFMADSIKFLSPVPVLSGVADTALVAERVTNEMGTYWRLSSQKLPSGGAGSTITPITNAALLTAIGNHSLVPLNYYKITDASDLGIILQAMNDSVINPEGIGGFMNPDFQDMGDYSSVFGLTGIAKGVIQKCWDSTEVEMGNLTANLQTGDIVFWNGLHYQVISVGDTNRTTPDVNTTAYRVLPKSNGYGYIKEWDKVTFDVVNNWIEKRADKRGNIIKESYFLETHSFGYGYSSVSVFQWGNDLCSENIVNDGIIDQINSRGQIYSNTLYSNSTIRKNKITMGSSINYNELSIGANIYFVNILDSYISSCFLSNGASISSPSITNTGLNNITFSAGGSLIMPITSPGIQYSVISDGNLILNKTSFTPVLTNGQTVTYIKGNYYIILYNDNATLKYRYIDLTGTDATWTYSTSEP